MKYRIKSRYILGIGRTVELQKKGRFFWKMCQWFYPNEFYKVYRDDFEKALEDWVKDYEVNNPPIEEFIEKLKEL